jgi:hypothetical protein
MIMICLEAMESVGCRYTAGLGNEGWVNNWGVYPAQVSLSMLDMLGRLLLSHFNDL